MFKKKQVLLILLLFSHPVICNHIKLHQADSLFEAGKFTQAVTLYDSLFQQNFYSPQMLWRMAYVKESLGQFTEALIYLNLCYHYQPNSFILQKMSEIAQNKNLKGYVVSDIEYLYALYKEHFNGILLVIFLIFSSWLYVIYRAKQKKEPITLRLAIFFITLLSTTFVLNYGLELKYGIITADEAYLMEAPSAGSRLIKTLSKGHRFNVIGKQDIWLKVKSIETDSVYYVKKHQIYLIE
ncbi:MAG: hypothetical protein NZM38_06225 [Cytophagales bacterium]|nr:hypothetical protein [Cytophagales bacterium]MDW8384351.1 hypothetical protein [Flammeovirgaceae bacterium]